MGTLWKVITTFVLPFVVVSVGVVQAEEPLVCWGMDCGSASEMECCDFTVGKCCNREKTYCNETMCGSRADGWYCGRCRSFAGNDCCNDAFTICQGTNCGLREDYKCCPPGAQRTCCSILPPAPPEPSIAQEWWFWVGLIIIFFSLGFIGFVLWSDRAFIKYQVDKSLGKNPERPAGMPFHKRASVRMRSSFRQSRQAIQRASVRLSTRRRRGPRVKTPEDEGGAHEGVVNPEITALGVPPPIVPGPPTLDGVRSTRPKVPQAPQAQGPPSRSTDRDLRSRSRSPGGGGGRSGGEGGGGGEGGSSLYPKITLDNALTPVRYQKERRRDVGGEEEGRRNRHNPAYNTEMPATAPPVHQAPTPRPRAPPPPPRTYAPQPQPPQPQPHPPQPQQYPPQPPQSYPAHPHYAPQPPAMPPPMQYQPQHHYASPPLSPQPAFHFAPPPQPCPQPLPPFMATPQPVYGAPAPPAGYPYPSPPVPTSVGYSSHPMQGSMPEWRI